MERSCEIGLWRLTAHRISEIFGVRLDQRLRGKLATVIDQIEHGHHVFRAGWKHAFLKQYEKFSPYLRNELCSHNLRDFGLKKGLDHLDAVRKRFQTVTDRCASFQAECLNGHVDFPLLQRLALPLTIGSVRPPGIKLHHTRILRLLEVLLHGGNTVGGWTAHPMHEAILTTFQLSAGSYGRNQLRYDLRKLKGHGLLPRDGSGYADQLTGKGVQVALWFLFFHKRLCGPLAHTRFHHKPDPAHRPNSKPRSRLPQGRPCHPGNRRSAGRRLMFLFQCRSILVQDLRSKNLTTIYSRASLFQFSKHAELSHADTCRHDRLLSIADH